MATVDKIRAAISGGKHTLLSGKPGTGMLFCTEEALKAENLSYSIIDMNRVDTADKLRKTLQEQNINKVIVLDGWDKKHATSKGMGDLLKKILTKSSDFANIEQMVVLSHMEFKQDEIFAS